jgi:hypothetical protein
VAEIDGDNVVTVGEGVDAELLSIANDALEWIFLCFEGRGEGVDDDAVAPVEFFKRTHGMSEK